MIDEAMMNAAAVRGNHLTGTVLVRVYRQYRYHWPIITIPVVQIENRSIIIMHDSIDGRTVALCDFNGKC